MKNCYFPKEYKFYSTEYGYDVYNKLIKYIIDNNDYRSECLYINMIIKYPNSNIKEEVVEKMIWNEDLYSYEWDIDWCEGQTEVCLMGIYTDDFIEELCKRCSHEHRYSGGWFQL